MEAESEKFCSSDCDGNFAADVLGSFFQICYAKHTNFDKGETGLFKDELKSSQNACFCCKSFNDTVSYRLQISSKILNKQILEQSGDGPLESMARCLRMLCIF